MSSLNNSHNRVGLTLRAAASSKKWQQAGLAGVSSPVQANVPVLPKTTRTAARWPVTTLVRLT